MNRSLLSRVMPFILAFNALAFAAFFIYAMATFSASLSLPSLRWEYAAERAFILLMDYLIPIHAAAVAVAASLSVEAARAAGPGMPARPFSKVVSSTIVAFLVLTVAYAALAEGAAPRARKRLADLQYKSRVAGEYKRRAEEAARAKDFRAAVDAWDRYLLIDPGNKQVAELRTALAAQAAHQAAPAPAASVADAGTGPSDAQALVEKARAFFAQENWLAAHYYAQAAANLDPRRKDALQLASEASNKISGLTQSQKDAKTAALFQQKKDALLQLESGNALAAYYSFMALAADNPKDRDIATYLAEARAAVQKAAFFLDEARAFETMPGTQGILFLNGNDESATEAVSVGKMVELPGGEAYFYGVEAVRYDPAGSVAWHFSAPYGRREGDSILMRAVDRTDPKAQFLPRYLQGTRPEAERFVLRLQPSLEDLRAFSAVRATRAEMSIAEMWRLRAHMASFGLARQALTVEMAMRMVMPFAFLILSVLSACLGWAFRARAPGRLPAAGIILMPLVPVVLALLSLLYLYAHRVLIGFSLIAFGFGTALAVIAGLQVVLLAAALVVLAGQSTR